MIESRRGFLASSLATLLFCLPGVAPTPVFAQEQSINSHQTTVAGQRFHYLEAGSGETLVVLLHGWPQDADEWRKVMPPLASRYRVVAVDLPGVGGSESPARDFSKAALARELHGFIQGLGARRVVLVGHDVGGMVAYAYARQFPKDLSGAVILDVPLPGLAPWEQVETLPEAWHFRFHAQQPLAEQLVSGKQALYFRYFIDQMAANPKAITDAEVEGYAAAYGSADQLSAGFGFYRAFPQDKAFNGGRREALATTLLIAGGDKSLGEGAAVLAKDLRDHGASDVRTATIAGSGHWVAEEQPEAVVKLIDAFVSDVAGER